MSRLLLLLKGSELAFELCLVYCTLLILLSHSAAPVFVKIGAGVLLTINLFMKVLSILEHMIENSERGTHEG